MFALVVHLHLTPALLSALDQVYAHLCRYTTCPEQPLVLAHVERCVSYGVRLEQSIPLIVDEEE